MLSIKNLSKVYAGGKKAVDNMTIDIESGDFIAFIGTSGSGKTTALRMINRMIESTEGEITIDGKNIKELNPVELRRSIGYVIQQIGLMPHMTVKENIVLVPKLLKWSQEKKDEKAKELIRLVDLPEEYLDRYPSELSGGQKQRVGIARALANDPNVLLCDEATSALDPQTTDEILDLLLKIKEERNLTIVIITHEMQVIRRICDEVAVMENGRVIEQGNVDEVFENPQHEVTKRFVKDDLDDDFEDSIKHLEPLNKDAYIVRLNFNGNNTTQPVVSDITRMQNIELNILEANIKNTRTGSIGFLIVHIPHISEDGFNTFVTELHKQHVNVEVIKHG